MLQNTGQIKNSRLYCGYMSQSQKKVGKRCTWGLRVRRRLYFSQRWGPSSVRIYDMLKMSKESMKDMHLCAYYLWCRKIHFIVKYTCNFGVYVNTEKVYKLTFYKWGRQPQHARTVQGQLHVGEIYRLMNQIHPHGL